MLIKIRFNALTSKLLYSYLHPTHQGQQYAISFYTVHLDENKRHEDGLKLRQPQGQSKNTIIKFQQQHGLFLNTWNDTFFILPKQGLTLSVQSALSTSALLLWKPTAILLHSDFDGVFCNPGVFLHRYIVWHFIFVVYM